MSLMEIFGAVYRDGADGNSLAHMPCPQSELEMWINVFHNADTNARGRLSAGCF